MQEPITRFEAQQQAEEIRSFERELARLEGAGVVSLSGEQRSAIADCHQKILAALTQRFDIDRDARSKQLSLGMRIASFLGALALAASVFFLFYRFWGLIAPVSQVAILISASLGTFVAVIWIRREDATGYFTKLAAMVAFACFVLNIGMLGQTFNITPSDKAFVSWGAYAFLLAYMCDLRLLLATALICVTAFIAARAGEMCGLYWLDFGERPENFFPAAAAMFAFPRVVKQLRYAGFAQVYRLFGLLALFLPVLVLSQWGAVSYLPFDSATVEHLYQILGFVATAGAIWLGARARWPETVNTGVTFFVVFLYTKFYDWWWDTLPKYLFFLVLGLTAVLTLLILRRLRSQHG